MRLHEIATAIHGVLHGQDMNLPEVSKDTRNLPTGCCYVAIKGEQFDGHDFIKEAIAKGAKAIIANRGPIYPEEQNVTFLEVKDTIEALGQIAKLYRQRSNAKIVSLTGSCGKTTVKGMIESILSLHGKTLATKGNYNNHIGLPLTLLKLDPSYQYAVIEMGANHMGEINYLSAIACPDVALITNVRPAHLLGFGTIENVAKAKGEIYANLAPSGIAIVNQDENFVALWQKIIAKKQIITFGLNSNANIRATDIQLHPSHVAFTLHLGQEKAQFELQIPGQHTVLNALAAISCAHALGVPVQTMVAGLKSFAGVPGRLRRIRGLSGSWIIDDSYNANPGSMKAALEVLALSQGKRTFVMGDMGELGSGADAYHKEIGEYAKAKGIEALYAVGKLSQFAVDAFGSGAKLFASKDELVNSLKPQLNSQMTILVKGSRSSAMEVVTNALMISEG